MGVGCARHVHGHARIGKSLRRAMRRQPAAIVDAAGLDDLERIRWIAYAVDNGVELDPSGRLDQVLPQFGAALLVAPIADPDQIVPRTTLWQGSIQRGVRRLMPGEGAVGPAEREIDLPQHLAEREHAVIAIEIETGELM